MHSITVKIEWDWPDDPAWFVLGDVSAALHAYRKGIVHTVRGVRQPPWLRKKPKALREWETWEKYRYWRCGGCGMMCVRGRRCPVCQKMRETSTDGVRRL